MSCDCIGALVRRLADRFEVSSHVGDEGRVDTNALGMVLGASLQREEAEEFMAMLIDPDGEGDSVSDEALLTFLEQHGPAWFEVRLAKQVEALRSGIKARKNREALEARAGIPFTEEH